MASKPRSSKKAVVGTDVEAVEIPKEAAPKKGDSPAKAEYRKLIENYAKQNPAKYASKKASLLARLEAIA